MSSDFRDFLKHEGEQPRIGDLASIRTRYYVHYVDDGPSSLPNANADAGCWDRLYVFSRPKAWLDFQHDVSVEPYRKNARVVGAWAEGDDHYEQITDWRDDPT